MKIFTNILYIISLLTGIVLTLLGAMASFESGINGIGTVIGGGIFIALGITIFVLNRD
ncbi:MAG: hypothetical protein AAB491_00505 [Patescibacteria group bacterium]